MTDLTVKEHMTLQAADTRHTNWLSREGYLRDLFSEPATLYYARLDRLIDDPAAIAAYPMLTARLRRLREARRAARTA